MSSNQMVVADARAVALEALETNIARVVITDRQIREVFAKVADSEDAEAVSFDAVVAFYNSFDNMGLQLSEEEVFAKVAQCGTTFPDSLSYEEFACFVLKMSQW